MFSNFTSTLSIIAPAPQGCGNAQELKYTDPLPPHGTIADVGIAPGVS
jgi:hypothetical protein